MSSAMLTLRLRSSRALKSCHCWVLSVAVCRSRASVAESSRICGPVVGSWSSLMMVPVVYHGQVWSTVEVVSRCPKRATDWDVALMNIVADRLAVVVVQEHAAVGRRLSAIM